MEPSTPGASSAVNKTEDDVKPDKRDIKPVIKALNRVPRACNACRKQKMRCEGAENPPCKRCRNTGLECLFEKPSREASLTGEAGLERIRALEAHVSDIRQTQSTICNNLAEVLSYLRPGGHPARSPSVYPPFHRSPSVNSPSLSTPTPSHQHLGEGHHASPPGGPNYPPSQGSIVHPGPARAARASLPNIYSSGPSASPEVAPGQVTGGYNYGGGHQHPQSLQPPQQAPPTLPPFSSIQSTMGPPTTQPVSAARYQPHDASQRSANRYPSTAQKRQAPASSNVTSADSSDVEDDDTGELPPGGLVAPWEVLRGLADVAAQRASKDNGDSSEPQSRTRSPSPDRRARPSKRRKTGHLTPTFQDVVTKGIINESEARELFKLFYDGCSTFLPVFDSTIDTYESLHERSPFAVDAICMVGARVRDGGGKPSEVHLKLLEEVQNIARASLFAPVVRAEAVQAMILVSGWSDNGWLSGGHAVRMAMELSMHQAWPRLLERMMGGGSAPDQDRELVIASRIWFCLYLFEHQLSYGTGRPAVMKDDESIQDCRQLLRHPLAIDDDMRLVSTVELIKIRERVHNALCPLEGPVRPDHFDQIQRAESDFELWYKTWDHAFSKKWPDAAFYRQSLQIQQIHAQLFHNATALRGINGPDDVQTMPGPQRDLAQRSIHIASRGLDITVNSPSYREGMKYAVHYTHATATFTASLLLRLARLFPGDCDTVGIRSQVEMLSSLMSQIPGKRYALTLQVMLKRSRRRKDGSSSRSPTSSRDSRRSIPMMIEPTAPNGHPSTPSHPTPPHSEPFSPTYDVPFSNQQHHSRHHLVSSAGQHAGHVPHHSHSGRPGQSTDAETIWQAFEPVSQEQLPVWISDQSLGGQTFTQHGMDAFLLPNDYLPPAPQIW
ncbi:hypothetical protein D9611_005748 [Ephemerocybe angulata]|uniref:Zn(2)-C6 fungal-type domain-containing protein n=1 Tax=Ephemerocybe angulata TaxID=980116 RepID=A0A8H5BH74_9AGAR|nr:hypothetical protein D9611_005748 [Tulosesus angulatus]